MIVVGRACFMAPRDPAGQRQQRDAAEPRLLRQRECLFRRSNGGGLSRPSARSSASSGSRCAARKPRRTSLPSFPSLAPLFGPNPSTRPSTTVAFLTRGSDLLPDGWERMDERRVDRGNIGAVGRVVAGGEGADAPVVYAGTGGGLGGSVS